MHLAEEHDIQQISNGTAGIEAHLVCVSDKKNEVRSSSSALSLSSLTIVLSPPSSSEVLMKYM